MRNKSVFFATINPTVFNRGMKSRQVADIEEIFAAFERHGVTDFEEQAYMLATVKWETAHTMHPIEEYGHGKGRKYGRIDPKTGKAYYGRGYVQLTWPSNYRKMAKLLGIDLYNCPSLALVPRHAADILVLGMKLGLFAPKAGPISRYLGTKMDWWNARRTVNGMDKNKEIAEIAMKFHDGILAGNHPEVPRDRPMVVIERDKSDRKPSYTSGSIWGLLFRFLRFLFSLLFNKDKQTS